MKDFKGIAIAAAIALSAAAAYAQPNPYRVIEKWGELPEGRKWGATSAVYPDRDGNIWVLERCGANSCAGSELAPVLKFDPSGKLLKSWGEKLLLWPHGLFIDREGHLWAADARGEAGKGHQVLKLDQDGKVLMTLGRAGVAGNGPDTFNQPSAVAVAASGHIFVADGHGTGPSSNARVVKFSRDGTFVKSWGKPGSGPGEFSDPHTLAFDSRGRLFVGDRNNNRIQIFDQEGTFLEQWTQFGRPSGIFIAADDTMYVTDSESNTKTNPGWKRGIRIGSARQGKVTAFIPDPEPKPDTVVTSGAEGVAADARGNVYGAEVGPRMVKKYVKASSPGEPTSPVPFKLGTFAREGRTFPGLVLEDRWVADIAAGNAELERRHPDWKTLAMPADMKELIQRYEDGLRERLHVLAKEAAATPRPGYVTDLRGLRVRPPVLSPENMLNAAVNYTEHEAEMQRSPQSAPPSATQARSAPGLWERRPDDSRHNPYLFLKARTAVIADGEPIRIPPGRDRIDWECELAVIVGRPGHHVPIARAREHIFGYTLENDVSDRGGRGDSRHGSDWLVGKSHDTFAPLGPFIVPKEFLPDPHKLGIRFTLSGTLMQDSSTARMTHSVDELLHYASNVLTLRPGDVISTGSPAGVGSARNPPIFMKPGDVAVCTIEGIGTLTSPVAAAEPSDAPTALASPAGSERVIALVAFPELTLLDLVGPLQVLKSLPAPYRTIVVGERRESMATDTGLTVTPERTFAEVPRPFAIVVPGGPGSVAAMGSEAVQGYLRSAAPHAEVVGSVCTGGLVLAAAGLLEGRRATTHWAYAAELEKLGARYVRERWVEDGQFITAGGVSAGIDMALALAARLTDRATAERIQLGIEYDPRPPQGNIDWSRVGEADLARQRQGGTGRRLKDAARLLAGRPDLLRRLGIEPE